jgi:hypothetical protein
MENENGYVIYPQNIGIMAFSVACERARELSIDGDDTRVEDCDTERTLVRYHRGEMA